MKGPSLEAIRKFKQLQEEKKKLEYDKKVRDKLTTLEHRAAHGDKKAKTQLKQIEKVEENRIKSAHSQKNIDFKHSRFAPNQGSTSSKGQVDQTNKSSSSRPKQSAFNFDDLMKLAASNNNEVKCKEKKATPPPPQQKAKQIVCFNKLQATRERKNDILKPPGAAMVPHKVPKPPLKMNTPARSQPRASNIGHQAALGHRRSHQVGSRMPPRRHYYDDEYEDPDDYYESDGFVVDDEDDGVQDELSKTIRSVFNYDKRRCDLRERELDRQYRSIGRVDTFEDLEREERRASRLAAAEDAEALRDLEEKKRLKKQRLKGMRD